MPSVYSTRAGTLPFVYCEMRKKTISNSRRRIRSQLLFPFSACPKRVAGVDLLGVSECLPAPSCSVEPGLKKHNRHLQLINYVCMHASTDLEIKKRLATLFFFWDLTLQALQRKWVFFCFYCWLHNESGPNPSPYESSFVCPRCVKFWDDPLGNICACIRTPVVLGKDYDDRHRDIKTKSTKSKTIKLFLGLPLQSQDSPLRCVKSLELKAFLQIFLERLAFSFNCKCQHHRDESEVSLKNAF